MFDSVVGAVIMVVATTSLLSAVEVIEQAFTDSGRQALSQAEEQLLDRIGLDDPDDQIQFWQDSLQTLPREVHLLQSD